MPTATSSWPGPAPTSAIPASDPYATYAQRYNAAGVAQGTGVRPVLSGDCPRPWPWTTTGNFAIAWSTSDGVQLRRPRAAIQRRGSPAGRGFLVNTDGRGTTRRWRWTPTGISSSRGPAAGRQCRRRRRPALQRRGDRAGQRSSASTRTRPTSQRNSAAAMDADGNFVITWWGIKSQDPALRRLGPALLGVPASRDHRQPVRLADRAAAHRVHVRPGRLGQPLDGGPGAAEPDDRRRRSRAAASS